MSPSLRHYLVTEHVGGALLAVGIASLELATFLIFKASYAGVLAAIVQPVVALWAIVIGSGAAGNATAGR